MSRVSAYGKRHLSLWVVYKNRLKGKGIKMDFQTLTLPLFDTPENQQLPDPNLLMLYDEMNNGHLWLDTDVCMDNCSLLIKYIQWANREYEKSQEKEEPKPITLHIFSNGGDLAATFCMCNAIMTSKIPVHTINEGAAHSGAFSIFLAGHKRTMIPNSFFVAHEGYGGMGGSLRENKNAMVQHEIDVEAMKNFIVSRTNISMEQMNAEFEKNQDWYIREDTAKELGVVTE